MKKTIARIVLVIVTFLAGAINLRAVNYTNFYSFSAPTSYPGTNSDGIEPWGDLVSAGDTLYGTTAGAGPLEGGTVFAISADGTGFRLIGAFNGYTFTNGTGPNAGMALSGGTLYGTTRAGGVYGLGTVFAIGTSGVPFRKLHDFGRQLGRYPPTQLNTNTGGAYPETDLICSNDTLYGATEQGGPGGNGTLFKLNTDGSGFTVLHNFTNDDGGVPSTHLVLSGNNLFGTTEFGGGGSGLGYGTIFRVNTDGTGFTNLYKFDDAFNLPHAGLVMSGDTLYGTTSGGSGGAVPGDSGCGSVFKINTDGTGFTNFFIVNSTLIYDPNATTTPWTGLAINGSTIYADSVGYDYYGYTVFSVNTDGTGYTKLTSFNSAGDPGQMTGVTFSGGNLYCTAWNGGDNNNGTVFALILAPAPTLVPLNLKLAGNAVILTWSAPTLSLYSAPTLTNAFTKIVNATSPYTNAITGTQKYFRLN